VKTFSGAFLKKLKKGELEPPQRGLFQRRLLLKPPLIKEFLKFKGRTWLGKPCGNLFKE